MAIDSQALADFYDHIYKPSLDDGNFIWIQQTPFDGKPWGAGQLHTDAATLVEQIEKANGTGGAVHICISTLTDFDGDSHRKQLTSTYAAGIVLDIDYKDHSISPKEVSELLNKVDPIPSVIANTANGVHVYYLFEENIIEVFGGVHRKLSEFYAQQGLIVDPPHSSPKTTIRSIGSLGKSGDMTVGSEGVFGGPKYTLAGMAAAVGVTHFEQDPISGEVGYNSLSFSTRPQVSRQQLFATCAAVAQFDADAATQFESGAVSTYHDARMYSSQISHTWLEGHYDITDMEERRDHAVRAMMNWPGAESESIEAIYLGTLNTPSMRCDKWFDPKYKALCSQCKYGNPADMALCSPVQNAINDEATGLSVAVLHGQKVADQNTVKEMAPIVPAKSISKTIDSLGAQVGALNVTNPEITDNLDSNLRLPEGYFISGNGTLFVQKPPPPDDPDAEPVTKPISKPTWVIDIANVRQQYVRGSAAMGGYEGHVVGTGKKLEFKNESLNFPNELKKDLAFGKVHVFNPNEAMTYFFKQLDEGLVRDRPFVERLGWHRDDDRKDVFYMLGVAVSEDSITNCEPQGSLRTQYLGTNNVIEDVMPRGDVVAWRDGCLTPFIRDKDLYGHMLLILSAFAAPLYGITSPESGPLLNFFGNSTTGKTTALCIANSVYGPPTRHLINPRDTTVSLFNKIGMIQSLPVTLDEASTLDEDVLYDLAYLMTTGRDKSAMRQGNNQQHELRQTNDWNTCVLSTANNSSRSLVSKKAADNEAVYNRMIDIPIMNNVTTKGNRKLMTDSLDCAEANFGCVGQMYLQEVMKKKDAILSAYRHMHQKGDFMDAGRFADRHFTLIKVAVSVLAQLNMIAKEDMPHISKVLMREASRSGTEKKEIVQGAVPIYTDILLELNSKAVPYSKQEFNDKYLPTLPANHKHPDTQDMAWEDAGYFYCPTAFLNRWHLANYKERTRRQLINDYDRQLKMLSMPEIEYMKPRSVPVLKGRITNSSSKIALSSQRLYKFPKV